MYHLLTESAAHSGGCVFQFTGQSAMNISGPLGLLSPLNLLSIRYKIPLFSGKMGF